MQMSSTGLMFEAEAVGQLHGDVDGDHHCQVRAWPANETASAAMPSTTASAVGQPLRHDARRDRPEAFGRVLAVGLDIAGVVDEVHRRRREAERDERDQHLDRDLALRRM